MTPARINREPAARWQNVQTYVFVTVIAVLIWLYAESSTLQRQTKSINIQFVPPAGRELLIAPPQWPGVTVEIRGPIGQLDELGQLLDQGPIRLELREDAESDDPQRMQKVDLHSRLSAYLTEATPGVTVIDVKTPDPRVRVERYEERALPIGVVTEPDVTFEVTAIVPSEATVKMPASVLAQLGPDAKVHATLHQAMLDGLEVGQPRTESVKLTWPVAGDGITVSPETADVTFTITQTTKTAIVPAIPISLVKPWTGESLYIVIPVDGDEGWSLRQVEVVGPTKIIDRIESGEPLLSAELSLTINDLEKAIDTEQLGPVTVRTPPGVTVVELPKPIKYKVKVIEKP